MNDHPVFPWLTAPRRAWLYRVALAVLALAGVLRLVDVDAIPKAVDLVAALLGVGTAVLHTPNDST